MAIKGKGRSKRRGVAAAPKPAYVQPRKPLLARRGFQIGVLVFLLVVTGASIGTALVIQHNHNKQEALEETERNIVRRFGAAVDNAISGVGQPFQTTFNAFPNLNLDVQNLKTGDLSSEDAVKKADEVKSQAADAGAGVLKINVAVLIRGHADLVSLSDAQTLLGDALSLYEQVGTSFKLAAQASGSDRTELITHTQDLAAVAAKIFTDGYQRLTNMRQKFDALAPVNP